MIDLAIRGFAAYRHAGQARYQREMPTHLSHPRAVVSAIVRLLRRHRESPLTLLRPLDPTRASRLPSADCSKVSRMRRSRTSEALTEFFEYQSCVLGVAVGQTFRFALSRMDVRPGSARAGRKGWIYGNLCVDFDVGQQRQGREVRVWLLLLLVHAHTVQDDGFEMCDTLLELFVFGRKSECLLAAIRNRVSSE